MKGRAEHLAWLAVLICMAGCAAPGKLSLTNINYIYQAGPRFDGVNTVVYHSSDSVSTLIVQVPVSALKTFTGAPDGQPGRSFTISYRLLNDYDAKMVYDSVSFRYGDSLNPVRGSERSFSYELPARFPGQYLLELQVKDLVAGEKYTTFIEIDKSSLASRQSFLVIGEDNLPFSRDYLHPGEKVRLLYNDRNEDTLWARYYHREFPVARPPFSQERETVFNYHPDSLFVLPVISGETDWVSLEREGFYLVSADTSAREGRTLYRFYEGFPGITQAVQMIGPLRYITTREEYDMLLAADDPKLAVDAFWLKTAGNPGRAKTLIEKYYTLVEEANRYFTNYQEGWKTDRGIIYIVFGRPYYVYRGYGQEEWIYGEPENRNSLRFTFVRLINPFTGNDYMLLRSPTMKDAWHITVQSWRR
jgi:GWxTD domain-containing protein